MFILGFLSMLEGARNMLEMGDNLNELMRTLNLSPIQRLSPMKMRRAANICILGRNPNFFITSARHLYIKVLTHTILLTILLRYSMYMCHCYTLERTSDRKNVNKKAMGPNYNQRPFFCHLLCSFIDRLEGVEI